MQLIGVRDTCWDWCGGMNTNEYGHSNVMFLVKVLLCERRFPCEAINMDGSGAVVSG